MPQPISLQTYQTLCDTAEASSVVLVALFFFFFCTSLLQQEDSSDLKCQLHFAKEESALMCKKLTKLVKDGEAMKEELAKYRSLYGDVDATLTVEEVRTQERRSARMTPGGFWKWADLF